MAGKSIPPAPVVVPFVVVVENEMVALGTVTPPGHVSTDVPLPATLLVEAAYPGWKRTMVAVSMITSNTIANFFEYFFPPIVGYLSHRTPPRCSALRDVSPKKG